MNADRVNADRVNAEPMSGEPMSAEQRNGAGMRLHHVQVSCPPGGEDPARAFYGGVLGLPEVDKPPALAARGGAWFRSADGQVEVHVGVEADFAPARKAHPAFCVDDIDELAARAASAGFQVSWDELFPGYRRFHTADGNGNRVEILTPVR
ncbi:Catechol 2,3-dioxygenase [Actinopolymorpha singaporensis]|uniref:Catechol 2,3-dioxygenase n=2 Tax=Actinopolymorpha singaporensis TaxID=117157 RepID=A0A1H1L3E9_9ACTN|nr:Catechol 2,3-dioxygenase [Actinopolymorpha singaporensis]